MMSNDRPTRYVLSVAAATIAETTTYPLDLAKTRLQIQGESLSKVEQTAASKQHPKRGMIGVAMGIVREEGATRLWQGLSPGVARHVFYTGARMTLYDDMRKLMEANGETMKLEHRVVCGMTAGGVAQFIASPADLVKVQMQMEGRRRLLGYPPRVNGMIHAVTNVVKQAGVTGLWKGCIPNVQRSALVNLGDLTTYDEVKSIMVNKMGMESSNPAVHASSSLCAGFVGACMGTPADVIKTRVMNQPLDEGGIQLELGRKRWKETLESYLMYGHTTTEGLLFGQTKGKLFPMRS